MFVLRTYGVDIILLNFAVPRKFGLTISRDTKINGTWIPAINLENSYTQLVQPPLFLEGCFFEAQLALFTFLALPYFVPVIATSYFLVCLADLVHYLTNGLVLCANIFCVFAEFPAVF